MTMDDPSAWPTGRLLSTAARLVEHAWAEHLEAVGITHAGLIALQVLQDGPCSQIDLAHRCHVRAQTMSRILDRLERDDHVARAADPVDRRRTLVRGTAAGMQALRAATETRPEMLRLLEEGLQAAAFRSHLVQIVETLSGPQTGRCRSGDSSGETAGG
jgi:DNA-binding MarR family transcriptional regulator